MWVPGEASGVEGPQESCHFEPYRTVSIGQECKTNLFRSPGILHSGVSLPFPLEGLETRPSRSWLRPQEERRFRVRPGRTETTPESGGPENRSLNEGCQRKVDVGSGAGSANRFPLPLAYPQKPDGSSR